MKLLAVTGSLRAASTNTQLIEAAARTSGVGAQVETYSALDELAHFNPDLAIELHPPVADWVGRIKACDGLIVSSPEYAGGYPGSLKNALDWRVATDAFVEKPFMLLNASSRSIQCQKTLTVVLATMSGVHIYQADTTLPLLGRSLTADQILEDDKLAATLKAALKRFVEEINARPVAH